MLRRDEELRARESVSYGCCLVVVGRILLEVSLLKELPEKRLMRNELKPLFLTASEYPSAIEWSLFNPQAGLR